MKEIMLLPLTGEFAENKDTARTIRTKLIEPALAAGQKVVLDFSGVTGATQSFAHALISEPFRVHGAEVLDLLRFKNCTETVRKIIVIVSEYMQESA